MQFPNSYYECAMAMFTILKIGGFTSGGLNFDAKVRRNSIDLADYFTGHIGGMDCFAVGLEIAQRMIDDKIIPNFVKKRYSSFDTGDGAKFAKGTMSLEALADIGTKAGYGKTGLTSGKQEYLENVFNQYLLGL